MKQNFYKFSVQKPNGEEISLSDYKGKVLLLVNTNADDTYHQEFNNLERLYQKYQSIGLEILAFPTEKFSKEAILNDADIIRDYKRKYNITFPVMKKISLEKGKVPPLFRYLTESKNKIFKNDIKRNFTKFIISREGEIVRRFNNDRSIDELERALKKYIEG